MAISVHESVKKKMERSKAGLTFIEVTTVLFADVLQAIIAEVK